MHYDTNITEAYRLSTITRSKEQIFYCKISVNFLTKHTVHTRAVEKLYPDMLLSGCSGYDKDAFLEALSTIGAAISVHITHSTLTITLQSSILHAQKLLTLFEKMMSSPSFKQSELRRVTRLQTNKCTQYKEDARAISHDSFVNALYSKTDKRQTEKPEKLIQEFKTITQLDLKTLHTKVFDSAWTVTCGTNSATVQKLKKTITTLVAKHPKPLTKSTHKQTPTVQKTLLNEISGKQNIEFTIGNSVPLTLHHPDYLPFVFGLNVLGKWGGFAGRLMSTVREKEGLTYGIYARTESVGGTQQGHWYIMTFFSPEQALQGLTSTFREIKKIHQKGITNDEFERFKTILITQQTLLADSLLKSVDELHSYSTEGFTLDQMKLYKDALLTVSKKEVNAALKKYLQPKMLIISGAGPVTQLKKEFTSSSRMPRLLATGMNGQT